MRIITPNEHPNLDSAAATYAYSEFLKKQEERVVGAVFGDLNEETEELLEKLGESIPDATYYLYSEDALTLIGATDMEEMSHRIPKRKVDEIIGIEEWETDDFPDAEKQIEDVAAVSTIIAEKFRDTETEISREAATLLKEAINSQLEDAEATDRDEEILEWLKEQTG